MYRLYQRLHGDLARNGVLAVYSQGVSSNVRGEHPLGGVDKTLMSHYVGSFDENI